MYFKVCYNFVIDVASASTEDAQYAWLEYLAKARAGAEQMKSSRFPASFCSKIRPFPLLGCSRRCLRNE